jgi:hypothetical protein
MNLNGRWLAAINGAAGVAWGCALLWTCVGGCHSRGMVWDEVWDENTHITLERRFNLRRVAEKEGTIEIWTGGTSTDSLAGLDLGVRIVPRPGGSVLTPKAAVIIGLKRKGFLSEKVVRTLHRELVMRLVRRNGVDGWEARVEPICGGSPLAEDFQPLFAGAYTMDVEVVVDGWQRASFRGLQWRVHRRAAGRKFE